MDAEEKLAKAGFDVNQFIADCIDDETMRVKWETVTDYIDFEKAAEQYPLDEDEKKFYEDTCWYDSCPEDFPTWSDCHLMSDLCDVVSEKIGRPCFYSEGLEIGY